MGRNQLLRRIIFSIQTLRSINAQTHQTLRPCLDALHRVENTLTVGLHFTDILHGMRSCSPIATEQFPNLSIKRRLKSQGE
jgi:hypothetical protein